MTNVVQGENIRTNRIKPKKCLGTHHSFWFQISSLSYRQHNH